jgi:spore coat protein H
VLEVPGMNFYFRTMPPRIEQNGLHVFVFPFTGLCSFLQRSLLSAAVFCLCFFVALLPFTSSSAAATIVNAAAPQSMKKASTKADLFTQGLIATIQLDIPAADMEVLRQYHWRWGGERTDAKATVREGTNIFKNVAVHLKGSAGSFRPIDDQPCLTLNFHKFTKGERFHGLEKISLNNSVQDPSYLCEQLGRELFNAAGVPVPRASHARLILNGQDLGLYVLTEAYNTQFLKRHFKDAKGNFYDSGFRQDITGGLTVNFGENPKDRSALNALIAAARDPNPTNRWARLEKTLDVDRFVTMLAIEVMLVHWDGYSINCNNYRIFHDLDTERLVFMPHGMDQLFGRRRYGPNMSIFPDVQGMVSRAVLQTPEGLRRYLARLETLTATLYQVDALTNRVHELAERIRPALAASGSGRWHESIVAELQQRIVQRGNSLRMQIVALPRPIKFDSAGSASLVGWRAQTNFGSPVFQETNKLGTTVLLIRAVKASTSGRWSAKAMLESGRYRIEGKARTANVAADPSDTRAGASFRVLGHSLGERLVGSTDWKALTSDFELEEAAIVEVVCELRADRGEAWFDRDSIRLIRK